MFCPQCCVEYRRGFTHCTDCDVDLVDELSEVHAASPGDPSEDPFCEFWKGDDPRLLTELCAVLDDAGIPHRTVSRVDRLFNIKRDSTFRVGVPFSLYEKAERAILEAFGADERTGSIAVPTLPPPPSPSTAALGFVEDGENDDAFDFRCREDATSEIFSGDPPACANRIEESLHKYHIHFYSVELDGKPHFFVQPIDEAGAREIVKAVVEGVPLE